MRETVQAVNSWVVDHATLLDKARGTECSRRTLHTVLATFAAAADDTQLVTLPTDPVTWFPGWRYELLRRAIRVLESVGVLVPVGQRSHRVANQFRIVLADQPSLPLEVVTSINSNHVSDQSGTEALEKLHLAVWAITDALATLMGNDYAHQVLVATSEVLEVKK